MAERKSFFDTLFSEEPSPSIKRGKSVRFSDNDDQTSIPGEGNSRQNLTTSSDLRSGRSSINSSASSTRGRSPRDWLGLLEDDGDDFKSRITTQSQSTSSTAIKQPQVNQQQLNSSSAPIVDENLGSSWIDAGLAERRSKDRTINTEPSQQLTKSVDSNTNSWLDIKKQGQEVKKLPEAPIGESEVKTIENESTELTKLKDSAIMITNTSGTIKTDSSQLQIAYVTSQKDILILQAKVDILNMEKDHLVTTIEQLKDNHKAEINVLKTLNEQQLTMTIDVYKRQEEMLKEERDRRITELKDQLEMSERDREEQRTRYNEKVETIERECKEEVDRLKEMHRSLIKRLTEQHEIDLERLRRIKGQEIETVHVLHEQSNSLESLVNKWITNADRMESLYQSLVTKEDELIKGRIDCLDVKDRQLTVIEENWSILRRSVEREKESSEEAKEKLIKLIEEQRKLIVTEQQRLNDERRSFDEEKHKLDEERHRVDDEVSRAREKLSRESDELSRENVRLTDKSLDLEKRESSLIINQMEWKNEMTREKDNLYRLTGEVNEERKILSKEKSKVQEMYLNLQSEQQKLENKKILFDGEKEKLKQLAELIASNAQQLETIGAISLKEKEEGLRAMEIAKKISDQVNCKEIKMEKRAEQLIKETIRVEVERKRIRQEWKILQESKHSIVCNLCGNGLNRVQFKSSDYPLVPSLNNGDDAYYTNPEDEDIVDDRMILMWQVSAQQDAALLAEETDFVRRLKKDSD